MGAVRRAVLRVLLNIQVVVGVFALFSGKTFAEVHSRKVQNTVRG